MVDQFLNSFIGMFVAMDIIGVLPMYLGMTQGLPPKPRRRLVNLSVIVAAVVAALFALIGKGIFKFLGIAIYDFKVGGGIVLLVMAILDLIKGRGAEEHSASTGVVPLGVPLITGPGLIATVMLQVGIYGNAIVLVSMFANFVFAWAALRKSALITRVIGVEGTDIISKIAALLMTAIAFAMIRTGIFEAIRTSHY
ncbi:MAG: MarC family protein [Deltaproteobacteria bacterium]|nr:MarC family protein [Deltaproteobacteria bacterium]